MFKNKWIILEDKIKSLKSVLVAFSGGVDSSLLAKLSHDLLGEKAIAVTVNSILNSEKELKDAEALAKKIGIKHLVVKIDITKNKKLLSNDKERCYFCKHEIFSELKQIAVKNKLSQVIEASNFTDLSDYRPGVKACRELKIVQPFVTAGITKKEIRQKSKELGLSSWNKPSTPCLVTRIAYNEDVTEKKIRMIEKAEDFLKDLKFNNMRVRLQKDLVRIEVDKKYFKKVLKHKDEIINKFKELGFGFITLDLEGFRSGSFNVTIKNKKR